MDFDGLIAEGADAPVEGWDFSWFEGRATEERPSWGYAVLLSERLAHSRSALDIQTGAAEVFGWAIERASRKPELTIATESWPPNAALAHRRLGAIGGSIVRAPDDEPLPFAGDSFDLVSTRHPVELVWEEISRVLGEGGTFIGQMIGVGSNRELYEYLMGPQEPNDSRAPDLAVAEGESAGLRLVDLRAEALKVVFFDIGAVVHFLRKVRWTVPDFSVERYRDRLFELHQEIERNGRFVSHSQRYLLEMRK